MELNYIAKLREKTLDLGAPERVLETVLVG